MNSLIKRAIAVTIPCAMIAGTTLAAGATTRTFSTFLVPFGARPFASTATVLSGGATLPVPAYLGKSFSGSYEGSGQTSTGVSGSIFGYLATQSGGLNPEYCATGSGKGRGIFTATANTVDIACANAANASATTFGFLPPSGTPTQKYPSITGTDAPLAQSDYSNYLSTHASPAEPVELPSIFGAIAILYNDQKLSTTAARITLTDAQICGVYNGTYKTYGALLGTSDTTTIIPVYRSDGSGTSLNFSNHLATVCSGFNGSATFTAADPKLPANALGANGNGGVVNAVNTTNGAFGYAEAGFVTNNPSGVGRINYAKVKNGRSGAAVDPFAGLPAAANTVSSSNLLNNVAIVSGTGPLTTAALTGVRSGSCVKVVNPSAYANPSTGYPIIAVTYLLFNSNGNGSSATGLRLLEKDLTTGSLFKHPGSTTPITTVDEAEPSVTTGTTGYSALGSSFGNAITTAANACIGT